MPHLFGHAESDLSGANSVTEGAARIQRGDTVTIGSMVSCLDKAGPTCRWAIGVARTTLAELLFPTS